MFLVGPTQDSLLFHLNMPSYLGKNRPSCCLQNQDLIHQHAEISPLP